eukprot:GHRQ01036699.1.p2 GENE.GHRQ01036699.1~~GHRQ01036699.1.p2  ORF type:complete len:110 (-),score=4.55 GHRQ01036699.1:147-476(-)
MLLLRVTSTKRQGCPLKPRNAGDGLHLLNLPQCHCTVADVVVQHRLAVPNCAWRIIAMAYSAVMALVLANATTHPQNQLLNTWGTAFQALRRKALCLAPRQPAAPAAHA